MNKFGIIGCGKMGQALGGGILPNLKCQAVCCDSAEQALNEMKKYESSTVRLSSSLDDLADCDVVLLAVKPMHAVHVLNTISQFPQIQTILSIVAGMTRDTLSAFSGGKEVVRIMPNTPALVNCGSIAVLDSGLDASTKSLVQTLFAHAGTVHFIPNESMMDAVTGLSGSSPALFAMMAEALADAAVSEGLPRQLANDLARETMLGTAKLLEAQAAGTLKENVMSPGGTTAAGVIAAENHSFRAAAAAFVIAASQKSRSMK